MLHKRKAMENTLPNTIPHEHALQYMLAGQATVGLHSLKTGNTFWYWIKKQTEHNWVIRMDWETPEHDQNLFTVRKDSTGHILLIWWNHGQWSPLKKEYGGAFHYVWEHLILKDLDERVLILHKGHCSYCGRPLKDAESLLRGIGPVCRTKLGTI